MIKIGTQQKWNLKNIEIHQHKKKKNDSARIYLIELAVFMDSKVTYAFFDHVYQKQERFKRTSFVKLEAYFVPTQRVM